MKSYDMHMFNRIQQEDQEIRFGFNPRAHKKSRFGYLNLVQIAQNKHNMR